MRLTLLKSKIHRATITDADLNYEGSITIDRSLCDAAHLHEFEKVEIYNCDNGQRFSTYVIFSDKPAQTGEICVNGAAARLVHRGDKIIIACYADFESAEARAHQPSLVFVDAKNQRKEKPGRLL